MMLAAELDQFLDSFEVGALSPQSYDDPLLSKLQKLEQNRVALGGTIYQFLHALPDQTAFWVTDSAIDMLRDWESFYRSYREVLSVVESWESFIVPETNSDDYQSLLVDYISAPLTITQTISWLHALEGLIQLSLASAGRLEQPSLVQLQRFESGSIFQNLIGLPIEILRPIGRMLQRAANSRGTAASDAINETKATILMLEALTHVKKLEDDGEIDHVRAEAIRDHLMHIQDIPWGDDSVTILINRKKVTVQGPSQKEMPVITEGTQQRAVSARTPRALKQGKKVPNRSSAEQLGTDHR
jgi:hypothetical protein